MEVLSCLEIRRINSNYFNRTAVVTVLFSLFEAKQLINRCGRDVRATENSTHKHALAQFECATGIFRFCMGEFIYDLYGLIRSGMRFLSQSIAKSTNARCGNKRADA